MCAQCEAQRVDLSPRLPRQLIIGFCPATDESNLDRFAEWRKANGCRDTTGAVAGISRRARRIHYAVHHVRSATVAERFTGVLPAGPGLGEAGDLPE